MRLALTLVLFYGYAVQAASIQKGFEALKIYDFFKAKSIFEQNLRKAPCAANYGLSLIYANNKTPFFQADTAFLCINRSAGAWNTSSSRDRKDMAKLFIDSLVIAKQKDSIYFIAREVALQAHTQQAYIHYLEFYDSSPWANDMREKLHAEAFQSIQPNRSPAEMEAFLRQYPDSKQAEEGLRLLDAWQYDSLTSGKQLEDYLVFIRSFPQSSYVSDAENRVYELSISDPESIDQYLLFIRKNPENHNINLAWQNIYNLYIDEEHPGSFKKFKQDYPAFPFSEELDMQIALQQTLLLPVQKQDQWGFMDTAGNIVIPCQYDAVEDFEGWFTLVEKDGQAGIINKAGKMVIPVQYDDIVILNRKLFACLKGDTWGIVNRRNKPIQPFIYESIGSFDEGLAPLTANGLAGFINGEGQVVINPAFELVLGFKEGLCGVKLNGLYGYINTKGEVVISPRYTNVRPCQKGRMVVELQKKWGLIDRNGTSIIACVYDQLGDEADQRYLLVKGNKCGYADTLGAVKIALRYDYDALTEMPASRGFRQGLARVKFNGKWGMIDTAGTVIIPVKFDEIGLADSLIPFRLAKKAGFMDRKTQLVMSQMYEEATPFSHGLAAVKTSGSWALINRQAQVKVENAVAIIALDHQVWIVSQKDTVTFYQYSPSNDTLTVLFTSLAPEQVSFIGDQPVLRINTGSEEWFYNLARNRRIYARN